MSGHSLMKLLFTVGKFRFYWAERGHFLYPGLHVWTGKRHRRLLAVPKPEAPK